MTWIIFVPVAAFVPVWTILHILIWRESRRSGIPWTHITQKPPPDGDVSF